MYWEQYDDCRPEDGNTQTPRITGKRGVIEVGAEGLENSAELRRKVVSPEKLPSNPTPFEFPPADLNALIEAWPTLDEATKAKIFKLIEVARL